MAERNSTIDTSITVEPVYIKDSDLPQTGKKYTVFEICKAAENSGDPGSIFGCQKIAGIWRLHPATRAARTKLLGAGFALRNIRVIPGPVNPNKVFLVDGKPVDTSKLIISNIPLSFSNREILKAITGLGCTVFSDIQLDCARDEKGHLTTFKNGNRSIIIRTPKQPLPESIRIDKFTAFLYYAERPKTDTNKTFTRETHSHLPPLAQSTPLTGSADTANSGHSRTPLQTNTQSPEPVVSLPAHTVSEPCHIREEVGTLGSNNDERDDQVSENGENRGEGSTDREKEEEDHEIQSESSEGEGNSRDEESEKNKVQQKTTDKEKSRVTEGEREDSGDINDKVTEIETQETTTSPKRKGRSKEKTGSGDRENRKNSSKPRLSIRKASNKRLAETRAESPSKRLSVSQKSLDSPIK